MRRRLGWSGVLVWAMGAWPVWACTVCDTDRGAQVRAGIFDERFGWHVLWTLLPFPIFLLLTAAIYFGFPLPPRPPGPTEQPGAKPDRKDG